jgi:hypothetical protein
MDKHFDQLPKPLRMVVATLEQPRNAKKLAKRIEDWLLNKANAVDVSRYYAATIEVATAMAVLRQVLGQTGEEKPRMPVFLAAKLGPLEWIAEYGTPEQKQRLIEEGKLPASVVEGELVKADA